MNTRFKSKTMYELVEEIERLEALLKGKEEKIAELEATYITREPKKVGRKEIFTIEDKEKMLEMRKQGYTHKMIAANFGCSRSLVQRITSELS